jgi:hypothetical protein
MGSPGRLFSRILSYSRSSSSEYSPNQLFSYTENNRARLLKPVSTVTQATNFEPLGACGAK